MNWFFTHTPLSYFVQSFWRDEAFSYLLAKKPLTQILAFSTHDFSPPFYFFFLHFWIKFFGSSEVALRSLSLLAFFATWYMFYLVLNEVLKIKGWKLWSLMILFGANPLLNYYAFEARMYTLFAFFSLLSTYFFLKKKSRAYLITTILGLYTHYFMIFVVGVQFLSLFLTKLFHKQERFSWIKLMALCGLVFVPWLLYFLFTHPFENRYWITNPGLQSVLLLPGMLYTGYEISFGFFDLELLPVSLILLGVILFTATLMKKSRMHHKELFLFFLLLTFLPTLVSIIISYAVPIFLPRYLIFGTIGILLLLALFLEKVSVRVGSLILIILLFLTVVYNQLQIANRIKEPINRVVREIKGLMKPGDVLYVTNELNFHPAEYYLDENRVFIYGRGYEEIPQYVGKVLIPKEKVVSVLPFYPKKAFILNGDLTYTIQSQY